MLLLTLFDGADNVAKWWLWGYYSSPMMYGMNAIAVNEFLGHKWRKVSFKFFITCVFILALMCLIQPTIK